MGRIVYEVINFDFEYLDDARETLGALFDIGPEAAGKAEGGRGRG